MDDIVSARPCHMGKLDLSYWRLLHPSAIRSYCSIHANLYTISAFKINMSMWINEGPGRSARKWVIFRCRNTKAMYFHFLEMETHTHCRSQPNFYLFCLVPEDVCPNPFPYFGVYLLGMDGYMKPMHAQQVATAVSVRQWSFDSGYVT